VTSPVAALLAAAGGAAWLSHFGERVTGQLIDVRTAHRGAMVTVESSVTLTPSQALPEHFETGYRWIQTAKNGTPPSDVQVIDYESEREHNARYYALLERYRQSGVAINTFSAEEQNALKAQAPRPFWPVAALINQLGALTTYNKALQRWAACKPMYPELVALIWTLCSGKADALPQAEHEWVQLAKRYGLDKATSLPATQIVNPEQGKGANRPKADGLTIGGMNNFWLLEYFKFAGLYHVALPRTVQSKKDRKTYVVIPSAEGIEQGWHDTIFRQFQEEFWPSSAIKMDIHAVLRYTAIMVQHWEGAVTSSGRRRRPGDFVEGFAVASYKDLGSAFAVMNVATLGLPAWIPWPEIPESAQQLTSMIEAQERLVRALDEKKGEEEQLLRDYRDFLSDRDPGLAAFFRFTTAYAGHLLRKMSRRQRVFQLSSEVLTAIVTAQEEQRPMKLKPLIETRGFLTIATAIRQSTVLQQYYKSERDDNTYDVRYGLADELQRHSRNNNEFMRAVGEFIKEYGQENARVMERMARQGVKKYRKRITVSTDDMTQLIELVDTYGAPTVASLLIAYGYAFDSSRSGDGNERSTHGDDEPSRTSDQQSDDEGQTDSADDDF
jgi:hypothetical protein